MSTHLVIIEAKHSGMLSDGICLGYMGKLLFRGARESTPSNSAIAMVHSIRKEHERSNAIAYGCVSDGYQFTFLRIVFHGPLHLGLHW